MRTWLGGWLAVVCAAVPLAAMWGFTVDDALVTARVAANLAAGHGYRFNASGPITDAVTPLGWVFVIEPFARGGALAALQAARVLGALSWLVAAFWLGVEMGRVGDRRRRFSPLIALLVCAPIAAWASAGMETGVVLALATLALARSRASILAAGLAAAWRPELIPWAVVLAFGQAFALSRRPARAGAVALLAVIPSIAVALIRFTVFGRAAPLALLAKPSDLQHGLFYAAGAILWTGPPLLLLAPVAIRRLGGRELAVLCAVAAHVASLVLVGGDWMALFRLMVPVLPGVLLVAASLAEQASLRATVARTVLSLVPSVWLFADLGPVARTVLRSRLDLIHAAAPVLGRARRVAAVDVGWVGVATEAHVVDLSGITDAAVAALPGGHTSKGIGRRFLETERVDTVVLLLPPGEELAVPWSESVFSYAVERKIVAQCQELRCDPVGIFAVGDTRRSYVVLRVSDAPASGRPYGTFGAGDPPPADLGDSDPAR